MTTTSATLAPVPFRTRVIASLILLIIKIASYTYRIRITGNTQSLKELLTRDHAVIIACWHNRMFYFATYLYRYLLRYGFKLAMMSSDSRDGEIGATIGKKAGAHVVRGSSNKRGAAGLRSLYRAIAKQGHSIIILPDGSQGPVYKAKVGAVALSQLTRAPVLPVSCWASSYWRIGSWDRMVIPKPFARVEVRVGEEFVVAREQTSESLEAHRAALEQTLDRLGREAEAPFLKTGIES